MAVVTAAPGSVLTCAQVAAGHQGLLEARAAFSTSTLVVCLSIIVVYNSLVYNSLLTCQILVSQLDSIKTFLFSADSFPWQNNNQCPIGCP